MERIRISACGHFFEDEQGAPFLYFGDTAWELFHRLDRDEADFYLKRRAEQGFNVVQAVILSSLGGPKKPNAYGHLPLIDNSISTPNEQYFEHVDWVIQRANEHGLYVGLLPAWGSHIESEKHAYEGETLRVLNPSNSHDYGTYLAERYGDSSVIWILGGDRPVDTETKAATWQAMAEGIKSVCGTRQLLTFHPSGGMSGSIWWHDSPLFDFNMMQTGHHPGEDHYNIAAADHELSPPKPTVEGEPAYELIAHYLKDGNELFTVQQIRSRAYRNLFAGAAGHTYGCNPVYQMYVPGRKPVNQPTCDWKEALDAEGALHMAHVRALMHSRPLAGRRPDQELIASPTGFGEHHVRAMSGENRGYGYVYIPSRQTVAVRLGLFRPRKVDTWWYDPRTGTYQDRWTHLAAGIREFTPPTNDDWVLVVDKSELL